MSTKALTAILLAGSAGVIISLSVHLSWDPNKTIELGAAKAGACSKGAGDCLPDVNYIDTTGKAYTPQSLQGKVVVVNFWATYCAPCKKEIPDFSKTYDKYKGKGVVFLGVLTDNPDDAQLLNFQSDYEMSYPVVRVSSDIMVSYHYPDKLPTTFVFNRNGKQVFSQIGQVSDHQLTSVLDQLVAEK